MSDFAMGVPIDYEELLEFKALLIRADPDTLPEHVRQAVLDLPTDCCEVILEAGGIAAVLTPQARALMALLRVAQRP